MASNTNYEKLDRIAILTMDAPQTRNALSFGMIDEIVAFCERIQADKEISCAIVTGAGGTFSSGGNVRDMRDKRGMHEGAGLDVSNRMQATIQRIPRAFAAIDVPVIAAINGHAYGAGLDLALMCDIRMSVDTAEFATAFLRAGIIAGDGGAWLMPRIIGLARATLMSFTSDPIDAATALDWGLVTSISPAQTLLADARRLASRIASHPPLAVRLCKRLLRESQHSTLDASLDLAAMMQGHLAVSEDHMEAVSALLDKRAPRFTGR